MLVATVASKLGDSGSSGSKLGKDRKSPKSSSASISFKSSDESVKSKKVSKDSKLLREVRARRESHISQLSDFQTTSSSSSCDAGEDNKIVRSKTKTVRREVENDRKKSVDESDGKDRMDAGSSDLEKEKSDSADVKVKRKTRKVIEKGGVSMETSSETSDKDTDIVKRKPTSCRDKKLSTSLRSDDFSPERDAISVAKKDGQQSYSSDFDDDDHEASSVEEELEKSDAETKGESHVENAKGATFTVSKDASSSELSENGDTDKSEGQVESEATCSEFAYERLSSDDIENTVIEAKIEDVKTLTKDHGDDKRQQISDKKVVNRLL